jgi:hypothetical protein
MKNTITLYLIAFFTSIFCLPGISSAQTPAPIIHLRAKVDHLRLRAKPDKNAAVVTELPENTQLRYLGESGGQLEQVTLRGVAHNARWYKVAPADDDAKIGWVYGGAVALSSVFLPEGVSPASIHEDFLDIRKVIKSDFEKGLGNAQNGLLQDTLAHHVDETTIKLDFDNGKQRIIRDTVNTEFDGENDMVYSYHGQFADIGQYVVEVFGYEWNAMQFIDRRNGKTVENLGFPFGLPSLSPNKKWVALGYGDPYESAGGLQVFLADKTGLYTAFNIQLDVYQATNLYWSVDSGELFFAMEAVDGNEGTHPTQYFRLKILEP